MQDIGEMMLRLVTPSMHRIFGFISEPEPSEISPAGIDAVAFDLA